ncbi:MAG TPA: TldD/PmbA family protein [Burkholderiaceae bacterium]|nr:TldD/PmbA family protein [Burkholderiaceae bacterium]
MPFDIESIGTRFRRIAPAVDYCSLRVLDETSQFLCVRQNVAEPAQTSRDFGAMVTVVEGDGMGYAASSDLSDAGLSSALSRALDWARLSRGRSVFDGHAPVLPSPRGAYHSPGLAGSDLSKADALELLHRESAACKVSDQIVDWTAQLWTTHTRQLMLTADGGETLQDWRFTVPGLHVTAHRAGLTQTRSWGGRHNGFCQQGGIEVLARSGFGGAGARTADEVLRLLAAPNCPAGKFDLLLMPDQMMLQIHESIGHPLELDRILGDERNYAGTSFVTLDMFGTYPYGSALLNVTFDPTREFEFANFAFDDDGAPARREHLIKDGILIRPLGGVVSQQRARRTRPSIDGVATARASSWNRPPIDRMSNLNVEPGTAPLADMIASIDDGVLMATNTSWSIDDSRNKFQFGCEWGRRIRGGKLAEVVRNPNYRGISATFWRSLSMVGNAATVEVLGTPYCGKGEPNQIVRVGHASPACKFSSVDVFGAER